MLSILSNSGILVFEQSNNNKEYLNNFPLFYISKCFIKKYRQVHDAARLQQVSPRVRPFLLVGNGELYTSLRHQILAVAVHSVLGLLPMFLRLQVRRRSGELLSSGFVKGA